MTPDLKPVSTRPPPEVSTHVLVPDSWAEALRELSRTTRVSQADYLREVVAYLLETYAGQTPTLQPLPVPPATEGARRVSVVFRVAPADIEALRVLSKHTRVRQSEYLREGLWAVLTKYGAAPVEELLPEYHARAAS